MKDGEYHLHGLARVLPDEHFASVLLRSARKQISPIYEVLPFARGATVRYASHLKALHEALPARGTLPRNVLQELCLYPYLAPFVEPKARVRHLRWALAEPELRPGLGLRSGRPPQPKFFRLCPACFAAESRTATPYFHRSHQIPGLNFCAVHNLMLVDSPTDMRFFTAIPAAECPAPKARIDAGVPKALANYVQGALSHLARTNSIKVPAYNFRQLYLHEFSYRRPTKLQIERFVERVEARYGQYLIPAFSWGTWSRPSLFHFLRDARTSESLSLVSHLLLFHFLAIPFEQALERAAHKSVWACPNGYCQSYGQFDLETITVHKNRIVLNCNSCGVKFSIRRDTASEIDPKEIRILEAGSLGSKIVEEVESGRGVGQVAEEAKLPHKLVARILQELAGADEEVEAKRLYDPKKFQLLIDKHKQKITLWRHENPSVTRLQFLQALTPSCRFMKTADPAWLEAQTPPRSPRGRRRGTKKRGPRGK